VVPDHQVADPPDDDPEGQTEGRGVHHLEEPVAEPPHDRVREDDRSGDPPDQADTASPDRQHLADRIELAEVADDVEEPGADDRPDQRPQQDRADVLLGQPALAALAQHPPGAGQVADRDPQAVRRDRQRAEPDAVEDRPPDHAEEIHGEESSGAPSG
jgi:hypothetical protein